MYHFAFDGHTWSQSSKPEATRHQGSILRHFFSAQLHTPGRPQLASSFASSGYLTFGCGDEGDAVMMIFRLLF